MNKENKKFLMTVIAVMVGLWILGSSQSLFAQEWRWLRIGQLQDIVSERGAEVEAEGPDPDIGGNNLFWPAAYGLSQHNLRSKGLWIGCRNFYDTNVDKTLSVKVVSAGPRDSEERQNMIFEQSIDLIGKYPHPVVEVDQQIGTINGLYDTLDDLDPDMKADRMVVVKLNTSIGVSVTKKVLAFSQQNHDDYFIHDIVFKNTGIIDREGNVYEQTLEDLWFYFLYRYAFSGESVAAFGEGWGAWSSTWGANTLNHSFGENPNAADFEMRGFYSYYGPNSDSERAVSYEEDWGCPNETEDGIMAAAKYAGCATLHADTSPQNQTDNLFQPRTTWFISSDIDIMLATESQYDEAFMLDRFTAMTEGHPPMPHDEVVGDRYAQNYLEDARRNIGGGTSQAQGFGPYTLAPGDSVRIVFVEGVNGLGREKNREVGGNWVQYYNGTGAPTLTMPDGTTTSDHNAYKRAWVETGIDSLMQTYRNALANYTSDYNIPQPPPPPSNFTVTSGGDRITLTWADNATTDPNFDGYVIYRSETEVRSPETVYKKIFECDAANVVHEFDDVTATRGTNYYYYIQSKDDGSRNDVEPGKPLMSSMFWTVTSVPAQLRRPAGVGIEQVRVVPNPYDIRARSLQFGELDRIAFYELPPFCTVKIFTERGDLIWETEHIDGSGDELWDSLTSSGQIVVSGVYILYVEVTEDAFAEEDVFATRDIYDINTKELLFSNGDLIFSAGDKMFSKGESVFRKFVIIR